MIHSSSSVVGVEMAGLDFVKKLERPRRVFFFPFLADEEPEDGFRFRRFGECGSSGGEGFTIPPRNWRIFDMIGYFVLGWREVRSL